MRRHASQLGRKLLEVWALRKEKSGKNTFRHGYVGNNFFVANTSVGYRSDIQKPIYFLKHQKD